MMDREILISGNANGYTESLIDNCHFHREKHISRGDWHSLTKISYLDQRGVPRVWEDVTKLPEEEEAKSDAAVGILAFYHRRLHFDCILLVKQYRPSLNAYTIEMPSGLMEEQETPDMCAKRELKECTGFYGVVKKIGPMLAMDPTTSTCAMRLVTVEVNGDDPMNVQMNTLGTGDRFKEPLLIPVAELLDKLTAYAAAGFVVDSRIDAFAIGLVMGNNSRKSKIPSTLV